MKSYIGIDKYGYEMFLYHIGVVVYCKHIKGNKIKKIKNVCVDNAIIKMFSDQNISKAYIYDEIKRRYKITL